MARLESPEDGIGNRPSLSSESILQPMLPVRFESRIESLRVTAKAALERARVLSRVGLATGMVWEVRPRGAFAALRVLLGSSSQNISHIYRIHGENGPDRP